HIARIERVLDGVAGVTIDGHRLFHMKVMIIEWGSADEDATAGDLLGHGPITLVGASALIFIFTVEGDDIQTTGKAGATHVHHGIVESEILVDLTANLLEFVGDLAVHGRSRQEPDIATTGAPLEQTELAKTWDPGEGVDRDLQRRNGFGLFVVDVARLCR